MIYKNYVSFKKAFSAVALLSGVLNTSAYGMDMEWDPFPFYRKEDLLVLQEMSMAIQSQNLPNSPKLTYNVKDLPVPQEKSMTIQSQILPNSTKPIFYIKEFPVPQKKSLPVQSKILPNSTKPIFYIKEPLVPQKKSVAIQNKVLPSSTKPISNVKELPVPQENKIVSGDGTSLGIYSGYWYDEFSLPAQEYFRNNKISPYELWHPPHREAYKLSPEDEIARVRLCKTIKKREADKIRTYYASAYYWENKKVSDESNARFEAEFIRNIVKRTDLSPPEIEEELRKYHAANNRRLKEEAVSKERSDLKAIENCIKYFTPYAPKICQEEESKHAQRELALHAEAQRKLAKYQTRQAERDKTMQAHRQMMSEKYTGTMDEYLHHEIVVKQYDPKPNIYSK